MAYPNKPSDEYNLRDYDFGVNDTNKLPIDEYLFKNGYKNADESIIESVPDAHNVNWLYDVLYRNLRYTKDTAEENKRLLETKLATTTNIGQIKVGYGLEITSNGVLSVAKQVAESANIISYDLPVGSYMLWAGNNTPEYFIEPAGQTLLKSSYQELWQFANDNGLLEKLFENIDDTSFRVKDIRGSFISIANNNDKVGTYTQAGLPNITGSFGFSGTDPRTYNPFGNGAIRVNLYSGAGNGHDNPVGNGGATFTFDASKSNNLYGKSSTVMPANWGLKLILKALPTPPSNAVPTGSIITYTGLNAPDGYIIANGAELSRTTFSNLFNWAVANELMKPQSDIPSTAHGYYGTGDNSTTFTIPDLRGVFTRWADLASDRGGTNARDYQQDGAPNITGDFHGSDVGGAGGAFYKSGGQDAGADWAGGYKGIHYGFNANRSSNVYGRASEIRPKSVSQIPLLKY